MPTIYIDDKPYEVKEGQNLLNACLSLGFDIPYFCWHPAMGSVGACRQCAVKQFKDEDDKKGRIVMSCMTPAEDGTRISIDDEEVRQFRASIIEWLMVNHPHDCPVCDEGGECHLQDMTVMTGHNYRHYRFNKRTYRNQDLGPFINHEMNRCIQCYRCVRFYRDYAGGRDLNAFGCHDHVFFGRSGSGTLENEFSGNLVEVCPTGVFTDKTLKRHYTRKWDLQTAPSVCVHCSLGCNTIPGERYGELRRIRNRYHHDINGYFLCDRGRYGYEFVNSEKRIRQPMRRVQKKAPLQPIDKDIALAMAAAMIKNARSVICIGSPRASLESNFMLKALAGADHFFAGLSEPDWQILHRAADILAKSPVPVGSLREAAESDAVFVLGENVSDTAPILALKLRQLIHLQAARIARSTRIPAWDDAGLREVAQYEKETLYIATAYPTRLDNVAKRVCCTDRDNMARLGSQVASLLDPSAPPVEGLPDDLRDSAASIAEGLGKARRPMVISGTGYGSLPLLEAAADVALALHAAGLDARLLYTFDECNSLGLGLLGGRGGLDSALDALQNGQADTLVILENDLFDRIDADRAEKILAAARHVICLDHLAHATTKRADLVLPATVFAESTGTLVNNEGRAQRYFQVYAPSNGVRDSWRWIRDMASAAGRLPVGKWQTIDDVLAAMTASLPEGADPAKAAPDAAFRIVGRKVPRQSHRYSGRTAMHANVNVHEFPPANDRDAPLVFSMEGHEAPLPPAALIPRFWWPGWNSVQSLKKFQEEIAGPLRGGSAGNKLLKSSPEEKGAYFSNIPPIRKLGENQRHLVPIHHVFGSEELSMHAPGIAARAPAPYLALSPEDAASMGIEAEDMVSVTLGETVLDLPVRIMPGLAAQTAGLPVGLTKRQGAFKREVVSIQRRKDHA